MNRVKVFFDEQSATHQKQRLAIRRDTAYKKLEALRLAIKSLLRKDPGKADMEHFMEDCETEAGAAVLAFEAWARMENMNLPAKPSKLVLSGAVDLDPVVVDVVDAWREADGISKNWRHYWSDAKQQFVERPVTVGEAKEIDERNTYYGSDERAAERAKFVLSLADVINFSNEHFRAGVDMGKLRSDAPWLAALLKFDKTKRYPGGGLHFLPAKEKFMIQGEGKPLFED